MYIRTKNVRILVRLLLTGAAAAAAVLSACCDWPVDRFEDGCQYSQAQICPCVVPPISPIRIILCACWPLYILVAAGSFPLPSMTKAEEISGKGQQNER